MNDDEFDALRSKHADEYFNTGFMIHGKLITDDRFYRIVDILTVGWNKENKYKSWQEYMQSKEYDDVIMAEAIAMLRKGWPDTRIEGGRVTLDKIKRYTIRKTQGLEHYYWPSPEELIEWDENRNRMMNDPTLEYNPKTGGFTKKKT